MLCLQAHSPSGSLTSVAAEDLLINNGGNREAVKAVSESLPQLYVEPAFTWEEHTITPG